MAWMQCHLFSKALYSSTTVNVLLPTPNPEAGAAGENDSYPRGGQKYPVLYLLHGFSADGYDWLRGSGIERYAQMRRIAVVLPSAGNSFYQNLPSGANYADFILDELPAFVQGVFPVSAKRAHNYIAGLSMGGYGAVLYALRRPGQYAAAASLSGALWKLDESFAPGSLPPGISLPVFPPLELAFGRNFERYDADSCDIPTMLQNALQAGVELPKLYQCCGTEDPIYPLNAKFKTFARGLAFDYTYEEGPGTHDYSFWDPYISKVLDWLPLTRGFAD